MSGMNPWLANIYGTDGADDLEKTAQSHLLDKLAQEGNIDLSQLSEEDIQALLQEVLGQQAQPGDAAQQAAPQGMAPQGMAPQAMHPSMAQAFGGPQGQPQVPQGMPPQAMQPQAGGSDPSAFQKEAQAKFEEADLLGRVMAHAYTQELEKIASAKMLPGKGALGFADKVKGQVSGHAKGVAQAARKVVKENPRASKAVGAGAVVGGAFAAGRASKKEKTASAGPAFLKLAEMHAADILGAAGIDPASGADQWAAQQAPEQTQGQPDQVQGQEAAPQDGQAGGEQFAAALDETALNMLSQAGYDVNEILARLQFAQQNQGQS